LPKVKGEQNMGVLWQFAKTKGRHGTFEGDLHGCKSCGRRSTSPSEMFGGQGADFLKAVAFWGIKSSGLLKCFCVTATPPMTWPHFFVTGAIL